MDMLIWGIVCIVMAIAEVVTLQLVSVWFSVGALAAFLAAPDHQKGDVQKNSTHQCRP